MWTRKELKEKGKTAFQRNYWKCVLVGLILMALTGTVDYSWKGNMKEIKESLKAAAFQAGVSVETIVAILLGILGVSVLIALVINIFLRNPLLVGINRYFMKNAQQPAEIKELGYSFSGGRYLKTVGAMVLVNVFVALWSLLLVIPGIIKIFEYYMVGYILADDPDMGVMDALRKSKEMMRGHKWNTFVLNLSFLGWKLLGAITFGIVDIFYVNPYIQATEAELYLTLKNQ
ncbi:MAG: DUF975 family protein [Lachnospiraceae bacterium]